MRDNAIWIGIPTYTGQVEGRLAISLVSNIRTLEHAGYAVNVKMVHNMCYVDYARNMIANDFFTSGCQDLVFVDSDLRFPEDSILRLVQSNKHIVGGAYPVKFANKFTCEVYTDETGKPVVDARDGMIKAKYAPTGLLKINRKVFREFVERDPDWIDEEKNLYHYFRTGMVMKHKGDRKWYGEDVFFCRQAEEFGFPIWLIPDIEFGHIGGIEKTGSLAEFLSRDK